MKFIVTAFILLVVSGIAVLIFSQEHMQKERSHGPIVALGDSLTVGMGATPGYDYVSVLSRRIGEPVINAGVNGDTAADALARLEGDVLSKNPRLVLVLLGGNDVLQRVLPEESLKNITEIVERIQDDGAVVILIGIRGGLLRDTFKEGFEHLASEKHAGYVPDILDDIWNKPSLMNDPIHPNDEGYALMAERIEPVLEKYLH